MIAFLSTYYDAIGMTPAGILTTIFGSFCVTFVVIICWGKLVEDFGPAGGMLSAAIIIGTFWVVNHKLPGFGINPDCIASPDGGIKQYGMIYQAYRGACPWVDMGTTIAIGLWCHSLFMGKPGERLALVRESLPRVAALVFGGIIGGAILGLISSSGANLFGG